MSFIMDAALNYAEQGLSVLPLVTNKKVPATEHGCLDATTDKAILREMFGKQNNLNIGIATGNKSGILVVDVDVKNGKVGIGSLRELEKDNSELPDTRKIITHSDGIHFYYEMPKNKIIKNSQSLIGADLDIRADGGYVVAPPSNIDGKFYRVENKNQSVVLAPTWLIDLLHEEKTKESDGKYSEPIKLLLPNGKTRGDNWSCQCPFHNDNTPSFSIDLVKGVFNCFGCDAKGNIGDLYFKLEGWSLLIDLKELDKHLPCLAALKPEQLTVAKRELKIRYGLNLNDLQQAITKYKKKIHVSEKPIVRLNQPHRDITKEIVGILNKENDPPKIFQRNNDLVRVVTDELERNRMEPFTEDMVNLSIRENVDCVNDSARGETLSGCPLFVAKDINAMADAGFPPLIGIAAAPILMRDGKLITKKGYDEFSKLLLVMDIDVQIGDVDHAKNHILQLVQDFPFDNQASLANFIALLLSPLIRHAINGCIPLGLLDAPQQGTGKSLLAKIITQIATNAPAFITTNAKDEEEWRKRITSILLAAPQIIVIDNIESRFGSASLAAALTSTEWSDRLLGKNQLLYLPQLAVWIATGNNVQLNGDMPRRVILIRLDAKNARPWERSDFSIPDIENYIVKNRTEILSSLFTLICRWYEAGKPKPKNVPPLGGFEEWAQTVGGILEFSGIDGFLGNQLEVYEQRGAETEEWEEFLTVWHGQFGDECVTAGDVAEAVEKYESFKASVPNQFGDKLGSADKFRKSLGWGLRRRNGMTFTNVRLEKTTGGWRVVALKDLHSDVQF